MKGENSMANYLIHNNEQILNLIVASSKEEAEIASGMEALNQDDVFILIPTYDADGEISKDENGNDVFSKSYAQIGWVLYQGEWVPAPDGTNQVWNGIQWIDEGNN